MTAHSLVQQADCLYLDGINQWIKDELLETEVSNFLSSTLSFPAYEVTFGYKTPKGNYRETKKNIIVESEFIGSGNDSLYYYIELCVQEAIQKHNKVYPHKAMQDIEILDLARLCDVSIDIF